MSERLGSTIFALADPTRRGIVEALAHGRLSAGELADQLDVIPAVLTRHLRVLRDERLVSATLDEEDHRRHIYELLPGPLLEVRDWADDLAGYWQGQLASFTAHTQRRGIRGRG
jgi:DNA-binding transcriptional ArsR family regulator